MKLSEAKIIVEKYVKDNKHTGIITNSRLAELVVAKLNECFSGITITYAWGDLSIHKYPKHSVVRGEFSYDNIIIAAARFISYYGDK